MPTYLSASDAARLLGVTSATVRLMAQKGRLRVAARTEGGIHLFLRSDVERLVQARARAKEQGKPRALVH